ncbi:MAG: transposase, partial [Hyphomonadaceae bacterium]|nr:transposase [Hyphomonadaceae bacterium]
MNWTLPRPLDFWCEVCFLFFITQHDLFDFDERLKRVSDLGDPLEVMNDIIDFEVFRPVLDRALKRSDRRKGGRPPFDPVMMFKILILQALDDLSDERAEFLITDRLSYGRFPGLEGKACGLEHDLD